MSTAASSSSPPPFGTAPTSVPWPHTWRRQGEEFGAEYFPYCHDGSPDFALLHSRDGYVFVVAQRETEVVCHPRARGTLFGRQTGDGASPISLIGPEASAAVVCQVGWGGENSPMPWRQRSEMRMAGFSADSSHFPWAALAGRRSRRSAPDVFSQVVYCRCAQNGNSNPSVPACTLQVT